MAGVLAGKVALITAAGTGIGRAAALKIAGAGAAIHVTDRDGDAAARTAELIVRNGGSAVSEVLDVSDFARLSSSMAASPSRR